MTFKIHIKDSFYSDWEIYDANDNCLTILDINPVEKKILSGDIIDSSGNIVSSTIRKEFQDQMIGVQVLSGGNREALAIAQAADLGLW